MYPTSYLQFALHAFTAWVSTGCTPVQTLNRFIPDSGYVRNDGIAYGPLPRQQLDLYQPAGVAAACPVVVFFYGGGWDSGDRADYKFVAEALTAHGIVTVIPDYRLYPEVCFPAFVHDAAQAVAWTARHAAGIGGDPRRLFVAGHSAGAHIAALLALDPHYLGDSGHAPRDLAGVIGLAGPYDFLPLRREKYKRLFGPKDGWWRSQPINFVSGANPPMLLMVGQRDVTVWPRNTYRLARAIAERHGPVEVVEFAGWGHVDMVARLARPFRGEGELLRPILDFVAPPRSG